MKYLLYIIVIALAVFTYTVLQSQQNLQSAQTNDTEQSAFAGSDIGGPFKLVAHTGITVDQNDFSKEFKLIYFGFTYCPSICPTELQKMAQAYDALPTKIQKNLQMMFITVDPERDTVAVMNEYVALFHPTLMGLTGSVEQVSEAMDNYRVYAAKAPSETGKDDDYLVDHSSFLYLMSPKNQILDVFKVDTSSEEMREKIERIYHNY
jgi:protein SCO1/2